MKKNIKILSQTNNLRLYVIEHTINIEVLISEAIGSLLRIDYLKSKSFGFSSAALSFNQKVQIIQDLNGIEPIIKNKLTCLMNIRNKFAHVQSIDTFDKLFENTINGKSIKKDLDKWYSAELEETEDEKYKFFFFLLAEEISKMLVNIQIKAEMKNMFKELEYDINKNQLDLLIEKILKLDNGGKIISDAFLQAIESLKNEEYIKLMNNGN